MRMPLLALAVAARLLAQPSRPPGKSVLELPQTAQPAKETEQQELMRNLNEAASSSVDLVHVLEAHLKKYPDSGQRTEIERTLAKAAIDNKDDRRTVLYGERALAKSPDDMLLLDRVARSLLTLGGRENATRAIRYAQAFEAIVNKLPSQSGRETARGREDRDRAVARALLYESRAQTELGAKEEAVKLAARAFEAYPSEEPAREWSGALERAGQEEAATERMADAFAIPDSRASDADRAADRERLGELYRKLRHSEKGLGDLILSSYDRTAMLIEERRKRLIAIDPNFAATDAMGYTLTGLDGSRLPLASLKGKVVILDFWATWCNPCRAQHPLYDEAKKIFSDRSDIVFLSIDSDEDRSLVGPFLDEQHWSKASVFFEDGLQKFLQVTSIPTTILFDKRGRVASRMNGFIPDKFVEQLAERIRTALADSEAP